MFNKLNKLFGEMVEASAAKKIPRFNDYHTGRLLYEKYLSNHPDLFNDDVNPTPAARREAKNSPELARVEELFKSSIEGANKVNDYADAATAYQNLGHLYYHQGRLEESKTVLLKSLDIFSGLASLNKTYKIAQSNSHYFLGLTLIDMKDYSGAEKELNTSAAIDKATGNQANIIYGQKAMAHLEERRKNNK
jgi:tetratricopeptide (TPR) repeat protein